MKKIKLSNILAVALLVGGTLFTSCNDINGDDRFIPLPDIPLPQPGSDDDTPAMVPRVALLEEFTGQLCVNCPDAHGVIEKLLQQYPQNMVAVSLHAGGDQFSFGEGQIAGLVGLRNQESEDYASQLGITRFPTGVINRTSGIETMDMWGATIYNEVQLQSPVKLKVKAAKSDNGASVEITAAALALNAYSGRLQLWVTESGIVAPQIKLDNSIDPGYVHNHVFRASANGHDGQPFEVGASQTVTQTVTVDVRDNWNVDNLHIVAFIYSASGVEQTATCHVE